jgi:hypothetical protein
MFGVLFQCWTFGDKRLQNAVACSGEACVMPQVQKRQPNARQKRGVEAAARWGSEQNLDFEIKLMLGSLILEAKGDFGFTKIQQVWILFGKFLGIYQIWEIMYLILTKV